MTGFGRAAAWLFLLVSLPSAATAAPSCHCFRDRDYDPADPGRSDEYLLATAANTLLSAAYGIPKRDIVQARMSGTPGEDLWVGAFAAHRRRWDAVALMKARTAGTSWRDVLRSGGGDLGSLGPRFTAAVAGGADDETLARIAAAETLAARLGTPWPELDDLTRRGASLQETVLAALIGAWSARAAPAVYDDVKTGKSAWSRLLAAQGRAPKQMESEVPKALRTPGR